MIGWLRRWLRAPSDPDAAGEAVPPEWREGPSRESRPGKWPDSANLLARRAAIMRIQAPAAIKGQARKAEPVVPTKDGRTGGCADRRTR